MPLHAQRSRPAVVAAVAVLATFGIGCGGANSSGPDMASSGMCTGGASPFAVMGGSYAVSNVMVLVESCGLGLMPDQITGTRMVTLDQSRMLSIAGSGGAVLGSGSLGCNTASLTGGGVVTDGNCQWTSARSLAVTVSADNTLQVQLTDMRSTFTTAPGGNCKPPASGACTVQYAMQLKP